MLFVFQILFCYCLPCINADCVGTIDVNPRSLDLSNRGITDDCITLIFSKHGNWSRLEILNLSGNNLTRLVFPNSTYLPKLTLLYLQQNLIVDFPKYLEKISPQLKVLDLSDNLIHEVKKQDFFNESGSQVGIPLLFKLSLSRNRISFIREGTFKYGFHTLKRLFLDHNTLDLDESWIFKGLTSLIILDLRHNYITAIGAETLHFSKRLSFIYLDWNRLEEIWSMTVVSLQLAELTMSHNNIRSVDEYSISQSLITYFDLSFNNINKMPINSFGSAEIFSLNLTGNPTTCDCYLKSLLKRSENLKIVGTCAAPSNSSINDFMVEIKCDACSTVECQENTICKIEPNHQPTCVCEFGLIQGRSQCRPTICNNTICQNGATCMQPNSTHIKCVCPPGFHGNYCQDVTPTTQPTPTIKPSKCQKAGAGRISRLSKSLGAGVVVLISIIAFAVCVLVSLLIYYRYIRPAQLVSRGGDPGKGAFKFSPFYVESNNQQVI